MPGPHQKKNKSQKQKPLVFDKIVLNATEAQSINFDNSNITIEDYDEAQDKKMIELKPR